MHGLPGALGVTSTFPFVGRSAELDRLRTLLPRADGERGRVVVLGGEAGSGKSRLVREFAAGAAADGVLVLYGACDAVLRTPTARSPRRSSSSSARSRRTSCGRRSASRAAS